MPISRLLGFVAVFVVAVAVTVLVVWQALPEVSSQENPEDPAPAEAGAPTPATAAEYAAVASSVPYAERFDLAVRVLNDSPAYDVAVRACRDLLGEAPEGIVQSERDAVALATVESYLASQSEGSAAHQDAFYIRAKLLHRLGRAAEAEALFRDGAEKGWTADNRRDPWDAYFESLRENEPERLSAELFNRAVSDASGRVYAGAGDYIRILRLDGLWPKRRRGEVLPLKIVPQLAEAPGLPHHRQIGEALCYLAAGKYSDAVERLSAVDAALEDPTLADTSPTYDGYHLNVYAADDGYNSDRRQENTYPKYASLTDAFAYNEKRNIPYYLAAAKVFEGVDESAAVAAMSDFWRLNRDRPYYVAKKLMRLVYAVRGGPGRIHGRTLWVTGFLVDSGFVDDAAIVATITPARRRSILDLHMGGFFRQLRLDEARAFADLVVADYDASDGASNNSLFALGVIEHLEGDSGAAEATFQRLLTEKTSAVWDRAASSQLAAIWMEQGRPAAQVDAALTRLAAAPPGEVKFYRYDLPLAKRQVYAAEP